MAKPKPKPGSVTIFSLRIPTDLKDQIAVTGLRNRRSLNSEIVVALRERFAHQNGMSSSNLPPAAGAAAAPGDAAGEGSAA
jgi:hypothetical protein